MNSPHSRLVVVVGAVLALAVAAVAAEPPIITKARAYLGPEPALNAVKGVHFSGKLVIVDSANPQPTEPATVEIHFRAPDQQLIQATTSKLVETTGLDGYDAWQRQRDGADPSKWQMKLLSADQIKRLRANTWESLGFFRGIESHGGRIEDQGAVTVDGIACQKLAYIYAPNIIFYRYIEVGSGRLRSTETETGTKISEQGEIVSGGIKFPKSIVTVSPVGPGRTQTITLTFDKVVVNEPVPPKFFAVPALPVK